MATKFRWLRNTPSGFGYGQTATPNSTAIHKATFGNDNPVYLGTKDDPVASLTRAIALSVGALNIVVGPGEYFNETANNDSLVLFGDGNVKFTEELFPVRQFNGQKSTSINITFENYSAISGFSNNWHMQNCRLFNSEPYEGSILVPGSGQPSIGNLVDIRNRSTFTGVLNTANCRKNTFYVPGVLTFTGSGGTVRDSIIVANEMIFTSAAQCNATTTFRNNGLACNLFDIGSQLNFVPTGATPQARMDSIRDACVTAFGGSPADYFINCLSVADVAAVKFNDYLNRDFTLQPDSPFAFLGELQTFAGAYDIGRKAIANNTDFRASTAVNITFGSDANGAYMTPTDPNQVATIESVVFPLGKIRDLKRFFQYGTESPREGSIFDSTLDVSLLVVANGTVADSQWYFVLGTGIVYGGVTYPEGSRLKGTTANGASWTGGDGTTQVYRISETPNKKSCGFRIGFKGAVVTTSGSIQSGWWYEIESGTITVNGTPLTNANRPFLADPGDVYTGSGWTLREIYNNSQVGNPYLSFEAAYILASQGVVPSVFTNGDFTNYNYQAADNKYTAAFWQIKPFIQTDAQRFSN